MNRDPVILTPAEALVLAYDMSRGFHWGAAPLPCWCSYPHPRGSAATVPPPWEPETPGGRRPRPPGPDVPAPAKGGAQARGIPGTEYPPSVPGPDPAAPGLQTGLAADGAGRCPRAAEAVPPDSYRGTAPGATASTPERPRLPAPAPPVNPRSRGAGAGQDSPVRFQARPPEGTRADAVPSGGKNAEGLAAWRKALAGNAKAQRNKRGKHRAEPGYRPGMTRRQPPGGTS